MTKNPEILAKCEVCDHEWCMHPLEEVRLDKGTWIYQTCYEDCDETTREGWLRLPQASEWVTVREAPAEEQESLPLGKTHPSHKMRGSWGSSIVDEVCDVCGQGDPCIGHNPHLSQPCRGEQK